MNSMERVLAAVRHSRLDRPPVMPQVFGHAAVVAGLSLHDYVRRGECLAQAHLEALRRYRYDAVFAVMDTCVEAEALGCVLQYHPQMYPAVARFALTTAVEVADLRVPDPECAGRMPEVLGGQRRLRRELGDTVPIIGCVLGPLSLATQLMGAEAALYLAIDDPDRMTRLLDFCTEVGIAYGLAQLRAGAHVPMVFDPSASGAVVPAAFFREFEKPRLQRLLAAFAQAGAPLNFLHIAGPIDAILDLYPAMGVTLANIDYCVDIEAVAGRLPRTCLDGNIRSLAFVDYDASEIRAQARHLADTFAERGGYVLSSGCEIPLESPPACVAALVEAVRDGA